MIFLETSNVLLYKKPTKEVLNFCKECTFYDEYTFQGVKEINHVRAYIINVLSESDSLHKMNVIAYYIKNDGVSLMTMNKDVDNNGHQGKNLLRNGILQLLCLEKPAKKQADKVNTGVIKLNKKKFLLMIKNNLFKTEKEFVSIIYHTLFYLKKENNLLLNRFCPLTSLFICLKWIKTTSKNRNFNSRKKKHLYQYQYSF